MEVIKKVKLCLEIDEFYNDYLQVETKLEYIDNEISYLVLNTIKMEIIQIDNKKLTIY